MKTYPPHKQPEVHYVAIEQETHSTAVGYVLWFFTGLLGGHRFFYGKPISGIIWFLTAGVFGIGWIVDAFLIPSMNDETRRCYQSGPIDYNLAWVFLMLLGVLGIHRFYQGKFLTGILFALTGGLFLIGLVYDALTLNEQISESNGHRTAATIPNSYQFG